MKKFFLLAISLLILQPINLVYASDYSYKYDEHDDDEKCPVGLVNGLTLDQEFGEGSAKITHCLSNRTRVKLMIQANQFCMDNVSNAECTRPYALGNLVKIIEDYEITHGMKPGRDYEIAVIAHTAGGPLMISDTSKNQFAPRVSALLEKGVKFYLCQNAVRAMINTGLLPAGDTTANIVPGVEYVTAGLTAVADFQYQGYVYVQP